MPTILTCNNFFKLPVTAVLYTGYNFKIFVLSKRLLSYGTEILTGLSLQYLLIFERVPTTLKSENQHRNMGSPEIKF